MDAIIGKTPFLRLLLPVIAGILSASSFQGSIHAAFLSGFAGALLMLFSFFTGVKYQYTLRWLFGAGVFLLLGSISFIQYRTSESELQLADPSVPQYYSGFVLDIPEEKPRSIACNVKTNYPFQRKIKLYLAPDHEARDLKPGEEILFYTTLQSFRNFGNPDDFDYVRFMKIKGFAGTAYIPGNDWQKTGRRSSAIKVQAQRLRAQILGIYRSLIDDEDARAFISALTLGYKADLSDDLQGDFRASGTAHVLAVSGLHVGIIYLMISLLFSFLGKSGRWYILRQWLVVLLLWLYVFVVGGSPSVVRAAIMLTIYCLGTMQHRRGLSYNTLAATAFLILILHPFSLFDLSFQMSYGAVVAILYFQPKLHALITPRSVIIRYVWNLLTVSIAAQLGVFPLVLYYFGTFPTWFFITNLLVVPLIGVTIYVAVALVTVGTISTATAGFLNSIVTALKWLAESLATITLRIVHISESLPFAQITHSYISTIQLLCLTIFVYLFFRFLFTHRPRPLLIALTSLLAFQGAGLHARLTEKPPQLVVFNSSGRSDIALFANGERFYVQIPENGPLPHPQKRILRLSDDTYANFNTVEPFGVDVLILSWEAGLHGTQLLNLFNPSLVVLDSSLPRVTASRITRACQHHGIALHDVTQNGAFSVNYSYFCPLTSKRRNNKWTLQSRSHK